MKLVLEGGGSRAAYSAGVCQGLVRNGVTIDAVIGSSSGSVNAAFVASRQVDNLVKLWTEYVPGDRFISWRRHLTPFAGPGLAVDTMLDDVIVNEGYLDLAAATGGSPDLFITATEVTQCEGRVVKPTSEDLIEWLRASLAIPVAYNRIVRIGDEDFIDGGVATPVPFDVPELAPYPGPTVVILTRKVTTEKRAPNFWERLMIHGMVSKKAVEATLVQHDLHNATMKRLNTAQAHTGVIVVDPPEQMTLSRLSRGKDELRQGAKLGYQIGAELARKLGS